MSNRLIDPTIRFVVRGLLSYRVTVVQREGIVEEKPELFIAAERLNEADFPDGTQIIFQLKGYDNESLKDKNGNFVVGWFFNHDGWSPELFMKNETVKDIRDLLRHWQETKDETTQVFATTTVSADPKCAEQGALIWITQAQFTIQMPQRYGQRESI